MGKINPWGKLIRGENQSVGKTNPWGKSIRGENQSVGKTNPWGKLIRGENQSVGKTNPWENHHSALSLLNALNFFNIFFKLGESCHSLNKIKSRLFLIVD